MLQLHLMIGNSTPVATANLALSKAAAVIVSVMGVDATIVMATAIIIIISQAFTPSPKCGRCSYDVAIKISTMVARIESQGHHHHSC